MGTLERMMNLLEPIQQGSIKVNSHAVQIYRTLSTKPIHIVKNVHILLSEFRNCALEAKHTTASILIFRGLFLEMCARNPYSQLLFGKGRTEFLNDLLYLDKSRYASQYLYLTLGHICQEHETHDLYFNLDAMRDDDEANCAFEFHFAFQRTDHTQNDLVWMRSSPLERKLSGSRNTRISNSFGPFCPGRLAQNSGLEMEIGEGFVIQQTWINTGQSTDQRPQMQLSSFLKDYQTRGPRLRLARLISEAVLRLDPSLWQRGGLESENVIVIAPLKYGRVDSLQSHIQVSLERHNTEHNGNCQQRQAQASTILSSLGLILLELAKAESILRPESEGCIVPLSDEEFNSVEHEMGIYYAVAVRFCLSYHPPDDNLYDVEVQRNFYERVVHGLRLQETEEDEAMAPAYEALALQGCLPT
ncbi:uncharacterized protein F4822DRAFT_190414 [Hypoxylon trugodes]|uniref:uncharacterized protein n=1 Tax=Hypoxylon trugodes TaxID=326681 RepID=UPI0021942EEF|nr:uncharacterized protein F4822DRAFT_190414 [Hypoxylon trugodes]KAI1391583.1 hypothetical protein F4822DRAFT_190414 [Hypoxylon trugodes]